MPVKYVCDAQILKIQLLAQPEIQRKFIYDDIN